MSKNTLLHHSPSQLAAKSRSILDVNALKRAFSARVIREEPLIFRDIIPVRYWTRRTQPVYTCYFHGAADLAIAGLTSV